MMSELRKLALQRWQDGPEDETVVDAMCDFAQKQRDEIAELVFKATQEAAVEAAWDHLCGVGYSGCDCRSDIIRSLRALKLSDVMGGK
jgi:hypothetical protein